MYIKWQYTWFVKYSCFFLNSPSELTFWIILVPLLIKYFLEFSCYLIATPYLHSPICFRGLYGEHILIEVGYILKFWSDCSILPAGRQIKQAFSVTDHIFPLMLDLRLVVSTFPKYPILRFSVKVKIIPSWNPLYIYITVPEKFYYNTFPYFFVYNHRCRLFQILKC